MAPSGSVRVTPPPAGLAGHQPAAWIERVAVGAARGLAEDAGAARPGEADESVVGDVAEDEVPVRQHDGALGEAEPVTDLAQARAVHQVAEPPVPHDVVHVGIIAACAAPGTSGGRQKAATGAPKDQVRDSVRNCHRQGFERLPKTAGDPVPRFPRILVLEGVPAGRARRRRLLGSDGRGVRAGVGAVEAGSGVRLPAGHQEACPWRLKSRIWRPC